MAAKKQPPPSQPEVSPHHGQVKSTYQGAQISAATFRPNADPQVTQTVGMNPDPPATRSAVPDVAQTVPYVGESPTGFNPATGVGWDSQVMGSF